MYIRSSILVGEENAGRGCSLLNQTTARGVNAELNLVSLNST